MHDEGWAHHFLRDAVGEELDLPLRQRGHVGRDRGRDRLLARDAGRCGEMWGDVGIYMWTLRGDRGRYGLLGWG